MTDYSRQLEQDIKNSVRIALEEDVGSGDITAQLIPETTTGTARVICRETAIFCGQPWFDEVFKQVDSNLQTQWLIKDGDEIVADQPLVHITGSLRNILTAERAALNFVQLLSGTATTCHHYAQQVKHTNVKLLDTRKTIPGLRTAQKYAVTVGGCSNHRMGLFDAFLIKENHITACGSIGKAINTARAQQPDKPVEVEVENLDELAQALDAGADIIMLDNFTISDMKEAVKINSLNTNNKAKLEASGGVNDKTLTAIAETGVDYISIGGLTKHCHATDLSLRIIEN